MDLLQFDKPTSLISVAQLIFFDCCRPSKPFDFSKLLNNSLFSDSSTTISELVYCVYAGYALYEVCANSTPAGAGERALAGSERVGDVLARWEKAGATAAACR